MKKIVIIGPESTGKTTMVKNLSNHFKTKYVNEYGREYTEKINSVDLSLIDYENITRNHYNSIEKLKNEELLFIDTEAITTLIFGRMYIGSDFDSNYIRNIIKKQKFDKWYLMDIDVPWVDDGTRDFGKQEDRIKHFNLLKNFLIKENIEFKIISGNYKVRFDEIIKDLIN